MTFCLKHRPNGRALLAATMLLAARAALAAAAPVSLEIVGPWTLRVVANVSGPAITADLNVPPPAPVTVTDERYEAFPVFNPRAPGWVKGAQLRGVQAQETTTPFLLDPTSLVVRATRDASAPPWKRGVDFEADSDWGTFGALSHGVPPAGQTVYASYRYTPLRLDSIVLTAGGAIELRTGMPRAAAPLPPELRAGERRLANLWIPGRVTKLSTNHLFPLLAGRYPAPPVPMTQRVATRLPKTHARLTEGGPLKVLAWGDSVTDGGYLPQPARERWQEQFVAALRQAFPTAKIELVTVAWGGRNTASFLAEPPGSPYNYEEKVLAARPDLIISEFVNDAGLNPAQVHERYGKLLADFRRIGAEWIILTPHYVRPDWMGLDRERDIDVDPRPYVAGLREFADRNAVGLADASLRYGHLWREGIPYTTLMLNSINHPDARGMKLFADALMDLFRSH